MTNSITIFSGPLSMFGAKVEMAAIEKGIVWERVFVPFELATLYEPKSIEVARVYPKKQVPVLIHEDLEIFDSTQIFEYLEDLQPTPALWPQAIELRAVARMLELKSDEVFFPKVVCCMPGRRSQMKDGEHGQAVAAIHEYFAEMNAVLEGREFLAGNFCYADIAFYSAQFFARFLRQPPSADLKNLERWRQSMNQRESVRRVMGEMASYLTAHDIEAEI